MLCGINPISRLLYQMAGVRALVSTLEEHPKCKKKGSSQTARRVAEFRADHQILESGTTFHDPFAALILGEDARDIAARDAAVPALRPVRLFMAVRSRFSEDTVSEAVSRGVRQIVVIGAGLDTFALRNPHASLGVQVFEVDHPDTQAWKKGYCVPLL
jgi:methyltransferase (TIGR00027 family)